MIRQFQHCRIMSKPDISYLDPSKHQRALSYAEFARREGISIPTARRLVQRHGLSVYRFSQICVRIPLSEIIRFEQESLCQ